MEKDNIQIFKKILSQSTKIAGFTGAGISTESGITDYRSKGGIWTKFQPVYFEEFLTDESKRLLYWQRKIELWQELKDAQPNKGHLFFADLYKRGKLIGLITQNIDGLHEKSGLPGDIIVNLHGTNREVICLQCNALYRAEHIFDTINLDKGAPRCSQCTGILKPNTISFGQQLRAQDLDRAQKLSLSCDLMIVAGSTLIVHPAASFPALAKKKGAKLAIITLSETPLNNEADFVFHQKIGDFLSCLS
jgi:NAD-dependent deacetylase